MEIPQIILVCLVDKYRLEAAPQAVSPRIKPLAILRWSSISLAFHYPIFGVRIPSVI